MSVYQSFCEDAFKTYREILKFILITERKAMLMNLGVSFHVPNQNTMTKSCQNLS